MTDIPEACQNDWQETIDAYAEDNRMLRDEILALRKRIAELHHEIGASREETIQLKRDLEKALDRVRSLAKEKRKLRGDVIEECAALMQQWADDVGRSQYSDEYAIYINICRSAARAIRALAKTSED